jgi:hypothetical protein
MHWLRQLQMQAMISKELNNILWERAGIVMDTGVYYYYE